MEKLRITAKDLLELGLVDDIIPEPLGGAHTDTKVTAATVKEYLLKHLDVVSRMSVAERLKDRYMKFRNFGRFNEPKPATAAKMG